MSAFLIEVLDNFKATTKMTQVDLSSVDSRVDTKFHGVQERLHAKGHQDFHLGPDGGFVILVHRIFGSIK